MDQVQHLVDSHDNEIKQLRSRHEHLEKCNNELREKNKELEIEITKIKSTCTATLNGQSANGSLVIGSSIIKDIDPTKVNGTKCIPGGRIRHIHQELRSCETYFSDVTILVGGNDCSARTDPEPVDELLSQYKDMVSDTESKAGHIKIATIIPRIQDANMNIDVNDRINALNAGLVSTCQENGNYTLINNDDFFKLKDDEINDGYFLNDGTHLNKKGSNRLAKSLGLVPQGKANVHITKPTNNTYSDALKKPVSKSGQATVQSNRSGPRRRPLHQTDHSASPDTRSYNDTNRPIESRQEKWRNDTRDRYSNQWDTDNMAQNLPRCYNCNESNHMVDSCRHRTKVTCFTCNGRGHKAKHCWH